MELDLDNKEWQDALQIVNYTRRPLFLTGKAGTGKSTFLRYVADNTKKKTVVLAPTGIAAVNAGGSTLHSFFRLPFHPLLPNDSRYNRRNIKETLKYTSAQRKLLREVELIIIDEISMVRADIIDFIDKVLRTYTRSYEPFGGKQLLLVGDIYQLEPVVREEDRQLLQPFYPSAYFFNAKVWQQMPIVSVELRKVYRQTDEHFVNILDRIRTNTATPADLTTLNRQVRQRQEAVGTALNIILAARRDIVDHTNEQRLSEIEGSPTVFNGIVKETPLDDFLDGASEFMVCRYSGSTCTARLLVPNVRSSRDSTSLCTGKSYTADPEGRRAVERARSRIGAEGYSLPVNNCEHFAIWCKTGIAESHEFESLRKILNQVIVY